MGKVYDDPLFSRARKPRGRGFSLLLIIILLIISIAFITNTVINRQVQLIKQSVTIPALPSALEGFKILHISDLHGALFGASQEGLSSTLKNQKYNIVCITGDLVGADGDFSALTQMLDILPDDIPVYFIPGDEDPAPIFSAAHSTNNVKAEYIMAAEKHGATYLDAPVSISAGSATLWICPDTYYNLDLDATRRTLLQYKDDLNSASPTADTAAALKAVEYRLDQTDRMEQARIKMLSTDTNIALTHVPFTEETIRTLRQWGKESETDFFKSISLILAGHYNNGQLRIPLIGPLWVPESFGLEGGQWFPDPSRISGLTTLAGVSQYISPGLGSSKAYPWLPLRFFNFPSVTIITLTTKLTE